MLIRVWDVFPLEGNVAPLVAGLVGAVLVHTIVSQLKLNIGTRLLIGAASFAGAFAIAQYTLGLRAERESRTDRIEREMMAESPMRILAEHDPEFRAMTRAFIMTLPERAPSHEIMMKAVKWGRDHVTPYLLKYLPLASDTTAAAVAALFRDLGKELQQEPEACITFIHGATSESAAFARPSKRLQDRLEVLMGQVFEEGIRSPQPRVTRATGEALIERLGTSLAKIHGKRTYDVITLAADAEQARARPRESCRAATSVFSVIAAMPPSRGGPLMRYMIDAEPHR